MYMYELVLVEIQYLNYFHNPEFTFHLSLTYALLKTTQHINTPGKTIYMYDQF